MKNKGQLFYGWKIVFGSVLVTSLVVPLVMSLANVYLISITKEMAISRSAFTLTSTITQGMGIFLSPFVAKKLALGNLRKIQTIGLVVFCISYATFSLAQSVWHFYIIALFLGASFLCAGVIPISMMITNWFHEKRGLAMSIAMTGIGFGGFIYSPLISYLLETFGWRMTYRIMALLVILITLPISLFIFKKKPEDIGLMPYGFEESQTTEKIPIQNQNEGMLTKSQLFKQSFFWVLLIGMLTNGLINSGALGQFPPALEELHGVVIKSTIISLYSLVGVFGKLILGWLNDRFGTISSTIFGCTFFALSFLLLLNGENINFIYLMAIFFGLGTPIGTVSPPLITSEIYGAKNYAQVFGITNSVMQTGLTFGSLIIAKIYDKTGSYNSGWLLLFTLTIVTMASWLLAIILAKKNQSFIQNDI